jgi:hypothetical protein
MYLTGTYLASNPPTTLPWSTAAYPTALPFAWAVHGAAWIAQFIGHGVFERRAPALTENLTQGAWDYRVTHTVLIDSSTCPRPVLRTPGIPVWGL